MALNFSQLRTASTQGVRVLSLTVTILLVFIVIARYTFGFPLLLEGFFQIICSEWNYYKQERRYKRVQHQEDLGEKGVARADCVATVIGYREDPSLFRKCLESYRNDSTRTIRALVVGIDGNEPEDMQMVELAESVCGATNVSVIELDEPFGAIAARMIDDWKVQRSNGDKNQALDEDEFLEHVFGVLVRRAAAVLQDSKLLGSLGTGDLAKAICITQPHVSKKDIMFTAFLFTLAIARAQDIPFIWSSDSDSYLDPTAAPVHRVLTTMAADPAIAGSCGALQIHNAAQSTITRLVSATYWTDLALTSGQNSAFDVTDCQPGPCAAFTTNALSEILMPWYTQTFLGVRPIVNEDRHLSTLLLSRGYRVTFHPTATVMTDAPSTFASWIVQQVRWSRAIVLETIAHPRVLTSRNPMFALYALRRIAGPYLQAWIVIRYLRSGAGTAVTSPADIAARTLLCSIYTATRRGAGWKQWPWLCASQVFLQFPQPPIVFWASATFLDGTWGNEAQKDNAVKEESALKTLLYALKNIWAPFICVSVWVGMVAAVVCKWSASIALVGNESICAATGGIVFSIGMLYAITK